MSVSINHPMSITSIMLRVLILGLSFAVAACGRATPHEERAALPPLAVRVSPVLETDVASTFEAGGTVQARATATVASRLLAPVQEVRVKPGDRVRAGQVLVVLDARDLSANAQSAAMAAAATEQGVASARSERQAAQASLELAKVSHQRIAALHAKKSATDQELDQAVASLRAAEAGVSATSARESEAQSGLASARSASEGASVTASYALVSAPFDGLVTEKLVEPGNMVAPGTPLVRIEDTGGFRLDVRLDESRAALIAPGTKVAVSVASAAAPGEAPLEGAVSEVSRAVDADARSFIVKIALPDGALVRSGMFGRAVFRGPARRVLVVPDAALQRRGQVTSVFVLDGDRARLRLVSVGPSLDGRVEVLAGLSRDERVVVDAPPDLVDLRAVTASLDGGR